MTGLGEKIFEVLSDANITARFQYMCGIRSHYGSKSVYINGNSVTGGEGTGSVSGEGSEFTNGCNYVPEMNGHDCHSHDLKHKLNISNGLSKEHIVFHKNGFRKDTTAQNRHVNMQASSTTYSQIDGKHNGCGNEIKKKKQTNTFCAPTYTIENRVFYHLFSFGASLGNELFYILFFSSTMWNFDSFVIRRLLIVWCVIMYAGQVAKDIIRWPRPRSPPVVRLEERYELEFGMPSTHAMVGVAIPFGMLIFMCDRYEFHYFIGFTIAITWSLLVSLSRLYLGMHSVLDILAGVAFAICLMSVTILFVSPIDHFLMSHPAALPVTAAICIALALMYPSLETWSTARGDTSLVLGVVSGIYAGMWLTGKLTEAAHLPDSPPYTLGLPSTSDIGLGFLRQALGIIMIVIFLFVTKTIILQTLCRFYGIDPKDPKSKQRIAVELPYKFLSYYISAIASAYIVPFFFMKVNIERQSYYSEVFNH